MEPIYYARQALDCLYTGPYYYVNYFITLREEINVWYCFIYFYVFVVQRKDKAYFLWTILCANLTEDDLLITLKRKENKLFFLFQFLLYETALLRFSQTCEL